MPRQETHEAKLRNQMGPMYGLYQMVNAFADEKDENKKTALLKMIIDSAKQAEKCEPQVKSLLSTIEKTNRRNVTEGQIEVLKQHIEHPSKPGYKRHDILDKIKYLKSQL